MAKKSDRESSDMTRGVYRLVYAGFIDGRRFNSISELSQGWFWRVQAVADDYGNLPASPSWVFRHTVGEMLGRVSLDDVVGRIAEMIGAGLLIEYEVDGEKFLHVDGWLGRQPAGRNGRRTHRVKPSPFDGEADMSRGGRVNPGASKGVQDYPGATDAHHDQDQNHDQDQHHDQKAAVASAATAAAGLTFSCKVEKPSDSPTWTATPIMQAKYAKAFPGLNVAGVLGKAVLWTKRNPTKLKRASEMGDWIERQWLANEKPTGPVLNRTARGPKPLPDLTPGQLAEAMKGGDSA